MVEAVRTSILVAALVAFASIVSYGIAYYSWKYADHPVSSRFALVLAADGAWAMFEFFQMISPTDAIAAAWLEPAAHASRSLTSRHSIGETVRRSPLSDPLRGGF